MNQIEKKMKENPSYFPDLELYCARYSLEGEFERKSNPEFSNKFR